MKQNYLIIIVIALFFIIGYAGITAFFQISQMFETQQLQEQSLERTITDVNRDVERAIAHCENNGLGCHKSIPDLLEKCQDEVMADVSACHDGRILALMESRVVTMSNECHLRLGIIQDDENVKYGDFDQAAYLGSIQYFEELCGNYNTLLD